MCPDTEFDHYTCRMSVKLLSAVVRTHVETHQTSARTFKSLVAVSCLWVFQQSNGWRQTAPCFKACCKPVWNSFIPKHISQISPISGARKCWRILFNISKLQLIPFCKIYDFIHKYLHAARFYYLVQKKAWCYWIVAELREKAQPCLPKMDWAWGKNIPV